MSECDVVLRVSLHEDNYSPALALIGTDNLDASWRAGETRLRGQAHEFSGANVILAEDLDLPLAAGALESVLHQNADMISALSRLGAEMEIDFGVYSDALATSIELSRPALEQLATFGVSSRVSFYRSD